MKKNIILLIVLVCFCLFYYHFLAIKCFCMIFFILANSSMLLSEFTKLNLDFNYWLFLRKNDLITIFSIFYSNLKVSIISLSYFIIFIFSIFFYYFLTIGFYYFTIFLFSYTKTCFEGVHTVEKELLFVSFYYYSD